MTKAERVLRYIGRAKTGRRFTDIQKFIVKMNGLDWDARSFRATTLAELSMLMNPGDLPSAPRRYRGYWTDYLLGSIWRQGLLKKYAQKNAQGRWVLLAPVPKKFKLDLPRRRIW